MSDDNPFEYPFKRPSRSVDPAVARRLALSSAVYAVADNALERITAVDIREVVLDATEDEVSDILRRIRNIILE